MKKTTRFTALILTLTLAIALLSACSEKTDTSGFYLYANDLTEALGIKDLSVPDFTGRRGSVVFSRDHVFDNDVKWTYRSFDLLSAEEKVIVVKKPKEHEYPGVFKRSRGVELSTFAALPDGGVLQVMYKAKATITLPADDDQAGKTIVVATDATPQLLLLLTNPKGVITKMIDISELSEEFLSPYPLVAVDGDSNIILCPEDGGREFVCVPVDGEPEVVELPESLGKNVKLSDGEKTRFYSVSGDNDGKGGCTYVTYENGGFSEPRTIPLDIIPSEVEFIGDKIWYSTADGAFLAGEKGTEKLFDWFDLGLQTAYIEYKALFDDDSGVVFYIDEFGAKVESAYIKRSDLPEYLAWYTEKHGESDVSTLTERQVVKVAASDEVILNGKKISSPVDKIIRNLNRFRRGNMQYDIQLTRIAGDESEASGSLMRMMLSGDVPDVVVFGDSIMSRNFDPSGFVDLYSYMDNDKTHGRDTFLPCVTSSFEDKDGRLPFLTTNFALSTIAGLRENFEKPGWTIGEFLDFAENLPADKKLTDLYIHDGNTPATELLHKLLGGMIGSFIDYSSKTCSFDSGEFARLLKVIKNANIGAKGGDDIRGFMDGDIMLRINSISNIHLYLWLIKGVFLGNEVTVVGFPGDGDGSVATISPRLQLAIPKDCANPDGGWTLIKSHVDTETDHEKYLISKGESYAGSAIARGYKCTWEAVNAMLDFSTDTHLEMTVIEYTGTDGRRHIQQPSALRWNNKKEYDIATRRWIVVPDDYNTKKRIDAIWESAKASYQKRYGATEITGMSAIIDFEESDREFLRAILSSECRVISQDTKAMSIINEEAGEYFNGRKTLEDAVRMIQNRVLTRINE